MTLMQVKIWKNQFGQQNNQLKEEIVGQLSVKRRSCKRIFLLKKAVECIERSVDKNKNKRDADDTCIFGEYMYSTCQKLVNTLLP